MHAVISLLLQSRKFWWYLLLTSSMLLHDGDTQSVWWQRLCSSRTVHRHTAPHTCNSWTAASRNAKLACVQPVASKQPRSQSCGLWDIGCHHIYHGQIHSVDELKQRLISTSGAVLNSRFLMRLLTNGEEDIERVSMRKKDISRTACKLAMFILSISVTFNVTCFDCYIFNYEIMPATLANTFVFILQGSALADLRCGGRFYGTLCCS